MDFGPLGYCLAINLISIYSTYQTDCSMLTKRVWLAFVWLLDGKDRINDNRYDDEKRKDVFVITNIYF